MSILRADSIRDRAGTGAPDFPNGLTGNLTGTATTATALAAGATGTDLTLSGDLTVNGTTTTIDTAVTAVDSLAVDGNITALGRLGIGTDNTAADVLTVSGSNAFIRVDRSNGNPGIDLRYQGSSTNRAVIDVTTTGDLRFAAGGGTERVRITSDGTAIFKAGLAEKFNNFGTTLFANSDIPLSSGNVVRYTGNEPSGNVTVNFTGVNSTLANGESVSFTLMIDPNGTGNISAVTIDGVAPATALKWSGGSAPSAGASGKDIYTFTILRTGAGTNAFEVYGAATNYA